MALATLIPHPETLIPPSLFCNLKTTTAPAMAKGEITELVPPAPLVTPLLKLGDRATSDVIIRLRTLHGRDDWFYAHAQILAAHSTYFALRLSDEWPTYNLLDSRNCIELICIESDMDHHVNLLRMLYSNLDEPVGELWHSVKNALGMLKVATKLGCEAIAGKCARYLEAVPWEESEEEEILRALPAIIGRGAGGDRACPGEVQPVLARVQVVDAASIRNVFLSAVCVATSARGCDGVESQWPSDLKVAAQEQVEYMLEEDDDAPILIADAPLKRELKTHFLHLFTTFQTSLETLTTETRKTPSEPPILAIATDLAWASRVLPLLALNPDLVHFWSSASASIALSLAQLPLFWETKLRVVEVTASVLKAVGYGSVILSAGERTGLVKVWLPFVREVKAAVEARGEGEAEAEAEVWAGIEGALVSLVLSLPSGEQAGILADWLRWDQARFPDLSEAFEVWCFRTKAAKRRLSIETSKVVNAISSGAAS